MSTFWRKHIGNRGRDGGRLTRRSWCWCGTGVETGAWVVFMRFVDSCNISSSVLLRFTVVGEGKAAFGGGGGGITGIGMEGG